MCTAVVGICFASKIEVQVLRISSVLFQNLKTRKCKLYFWNQIQGVGKLAQNTQNM